MHAPIPADTERVAKEIVDAAFRIHTQLGPGLLESVYETCMCYELNRRGLAFQQQVSVPIVYDDVLLETEFRLDLLVESCVVVEIKAVQDHHPVFEAQLLTYLRLTKKRLGLLINFTVPRIKDGIKRIVV